MSFAEKLIAGCLTDIGWLRSSEHDLGLASVDDPSKELELRRAIFCLLDQWAHEAEEVYVRALSLRRAGMAVRRIDELNDEIGRVRARLTVRPEQLVSARQLAREGKTVAAKELRDELNARLRG